MFAPPENLDARNRLYDMLVIAGRVPGGRLGCRIWLGLHELRGVGRSRAHKGVLYCSKILDCGIESKNLCAQTCTFSDSRK